MKELLRLIVALCAVCGIASAVLAFANRQTREARQQARLRQKVEALSKALPAFDNNPLQNTVPETEQAFEEADVRFYRATRNDSLVGIAGEAVSPKGYGGNVRVLVGFRPDGTIRNVLVTQHQETPGLGAIATDRSRQKTLGDLLGTDQDDDSEKAGIPPNSYLDQYSGRNLLADAPFRVGKDGGTIDAVSGATVSSRAVADAVTQVAQAFDDKRSRLTGGGGK